jgi:translation initiation factor 1A
MSQFFIRLPTNRTLVFNTNSFKKVANIKDEIFNREGIPTSIQKLILSDKVLNDTNLINMNDTNLINMNDTNLININERTIYLHFQTLGGVKGATHVRRKNGQNTKRELAFRVPGESDYGQIKSLKGDKRAIVLCLSDGKEYQSRIAGSLHQWIQREDIVLIGLRSFQQDKADIIWRYTPEEARKLMKAGEIQSSLKINDQILDRSNNNVEFVDSNGMNPDEDEDMLIQQKTYELPPSESESDNEVDVDDI